MFINQRLDWKFKWLAIFWLQFHAGKPPQFLIIFFLILMPTFFFVRDGYFMKENFPKKLFSSNEINEWPCICRSCARCIHISMTTLLPHTLAHSTGPSFRSCIQLCKSRQMDIILKIKCFKNWSCQQQNICPYNDILQWKKILERFG